MSAASTSRASSLLFVAVVAIMPVIVMVATKHPLPLGDDCRFPGFAMAIDRDGRWAPFKYSENLYYQFFHLIPTLEYVFASVTGVGVSNIMSYYLTLKIALYLAYFLFIFLVVKRLTGDYTASLMAILLLSITPPLAFAQVTHQRYAIVLFLGSAFIVLNLYKGILSRANMLATYPLWFAGIIAHATYTPMCLTFTLPLAFTDKSREVKRRALKVGFIILIISLAYWIYTYVLDTIVRPTVNAVTRLIDLLTGRAPSFPFQGTALPWYTSERSSFFIAWALLPSIVASYLLFSVLHIALKRGGSLTAYFKDDKVILGLLGLGGTALNYLLRTLATFGGRYFYWLYLLMLPLAAFEVMRSSKRMLCSVLFIAIISLASFYGVRDPTLSANTYQNNIAWADRTSWRIGLSIAPHLNPESLSWIDPRVGAPISALAPCMGVPCRFQHVLAVIGRDEVGLYATYKDPRNEDFFKRYFNIDPKNLFDHLDEFDITYNSGSYCVILKS
ncbi:hypothetical protein KEJ25_09750 [Candidatus Bathyarchaeota archaeon]|nr:hypothetical protein [Candidatus Bathyarchaeota archaeon]